METNENTQEVELEEQNNEEVEEAEEVSEEETTDEESEENEEESEDEIAKLKKQNAILQRKLTKAGKTTKVEQKVVSENLSTKDVLALTENKVSSQDYDEVVRVAKILGKPVSEALSDSVLKKILETRAEERKTAQATHTQGGSRGTSKTDGESLLQKAEKTGEVPTDLEGMKKLQEAKMARRKAQFKR